MRFILILLLFSSLAFAKGKDSCFSVGLKSFVIKNSATYDFEREGYPESCKLISFTNIHTVRCGCYEKYNEAKKQLKLLLPSYPQAMIVTTYKYRFAKDDSKKSSEKVKIVLKMDEQKRSDEPISNEPINDESESILQDFSLRGHLDLTSQLYLLHPDKKHGENFTASANIEMAYYKNDFKALVKIKAQEDSYDLAGGSDSTNRSFIRVDELYARYDFEDEQIMFGKSILFWGALEVRNITDVFNSDELRGDPFDTDKLGSWNASYTYFTQSGEFSAILKLYEQDRELSSFPYVYYYFPQSVTAANLPLNYQKDLDADPSKRRPSIYLKYAGTTDTEYPLDYALIFENGFDSQRYYTQTPSLDGTSIDTNENAYLVNKLLTYNTLVLGSTLYKLEGVYADVISDTQISDYYHIGLGVEHTLTQFYKEADLALIGEYYNFGTLESGKRSDLELFELFENDLFLGMRYRFNKGNAASIISGVILDLDYNEEVYYLEYETRVADTLKINFDYRYIEPSQTDQTAFNLMGRHERISLKIGYYF